MVSLVDELEGASAPIEVEPGEVAPFDGDVEGIDGEALEGGGDIGVGDLQGLGLVDAVFDKVQSRVAVDGLIAVE